MFDRDDNESHKSFNLGQAQNTFLPPTCNVIGTTTAQASRKRKLTNLEHDNVIGQAFTIKSHPSLPSSQAQQLIPRLRIPRSCLPLAYLDPLGGRDDLRGSNLFAAHIDPLEDIVREHQGSCQPMVLIAQSAVNQGLFAIERVQEGIYAKCKLGKWVTVDTLEQLRTMTVDIANPRKIQSHEQPGLGQECWWSAAAVDFRSTSRFDPSKDSNLENIRAVRLCLQKPRQKPTTPAQVTQEISPSIMQGQIGSLVEDTLQEAAQDPEEILKMVRAQYLDALYSSKTSLAYFAKGPLSRARATFNANSGSGTDHSHLTSFLRSCILSLALMDVKYRETLPDLVNAFPFDPLSDEECTAVIETASKKTRRSKKSSVGKNGLYPGEETNIARWWLSRDQSSVACDSADAREEATKSALLEQRFRETQMQIVLSLETLALESAASSKVVGTLPSVNPVEVDEDSRTKKMKKKTKKPQDLSMLLDLLVDRLCIWQSMSVDESKTSNGQDRPTSQHRSRLTVKSEGSDHLRQFCVDVVLPFYGARLHELTTSLCKKLGGPKKPSPRRPPLAKSTSSCTSLKPGASVQRQQPRRPRRTLERVLTDERSASQKPPPSLSRSATAPVLPQVKREVSDTSLSSIPLNRVVMHKRYSQREVDLYATSQAAEAKLKKKARVEQELQDAIAALKKPNPRMAVKELIEDAERRATAKHSRKPKNPVRNPFAQGAQVMATPSNNRRKDVYGGLPRLPRQGTAPLPELEEVSPSSISCVPSSSKRAQQSPFLAPDSTEKIGRSALPVAETPTRGPLKLRGRPPPSTVATEFHADTYQPLSLSAASGLPKAVNNVSASSHWPLHVHETPLKFRYSKEVGQSGGTTLHAISVKDPSAADQPLVFSTQSVPSPPLEDMEESIYAALGWDDVDDLL